MLRDAADTALVNQGIRVTFDADADDHTTVNGGDR